MAKKIFRYISIKQTTIHFLQTTQELRFETTLMLGYAWMALTWFRTICNGEWIWNVIRPDEKLSNEKHYYFGNKIEGPMAKHEADVAS